MSPRDPRRVAPRSRRMARVVRWAVGLALLGVVVSWLDLGTIGARLASADRGLTTIAILGLVAVHLIGAVSWRRLTDRLAGIRLSVGAAVRLYYAGQALGVVTPANLGSDVYRIAALDPRASRGMIAIPIIVQRVTSVGAMVVLGGIGALSLPIAGMVWFGAGLLGGALLVVAAVFVGGAAGPLGGPWRRLAQRIGLDVDVVGVAPARTSALRDGLALGLVFHGLALALGLLLVAAVDPSALTSPGPVLAALAVARLSLALPLSPGGIGIQEGVLAVLFVELGLPPETAVVATLLNRFALLLTAAVGSVAILRGAGVVAQDAFGESGRSSGGPDPRAEAPGQSAADGSEAPGAASGPSAALTIPSSSSIGAPPRARIVKPNPRVTS